MSVNQHVAMLKEKRAALANMKEEVSDDLFQVVVINSLPSNFGDILREWEMVHPSMKNIEFLLSLLQTRERESKETEQLMVVRHTQQKLSMEERKKRWPCNICKQKGHWANDCPKNYRNQTSRDDSEKIDPNKIEAKTLANVILNTGQIGKELKDKWLADSGTTSHMSNNKEYFTELVLNPKMHLWEMAKV